MRTSSGFSIVEALVGLVVLSIGSLGLTALQLHAVRATTFAASVVQATELASDLTENAKRWPYGDARLVARAAVQSTTDAAVTAFWDPGRGALPQKASFGEKPGDPDADTAGALGANYQGLSGDVARDGSWMFRRYWNVFDVDLNGSGVAQGKLVQVIVRWREPGVGERQVTVSTYKANVGALFQ